MKRELQSIQHVMYQSIVGSLLYVAIATQPDITQAVGVVSKFNSKQSQTHLSAAKRILHYLKGKSDLVLKFQQSEKARLLPCRVLRCRLGWGQ